MLYYLFNYNINNLIYLLLLVIYQCYC